MEQLLSVVKHILSTHDVIFVHIFSSHRPQVSLFLSVIESSKVVVEEYLFNYVAWYQNFTMLFT